MAAGRETAPTGGDALTDSNAVRCVWPGPAILGEGPVWRPEESALYFVDIKAPCVHRYDPANGATKTYPMPASIGCLLPRARGGFIGAFQNGLAFVDLEAGTVEPIVDPEADRPGNRFNDGKIDAQGRLFTGSMDNAESEPTGSLYRVDADLSWHRLDEGYICTNGPAFSLDGGTIYHTSSYAREIYAFDLAWDGSLSNKRTHIRLPESDGYPDGMTVDAEDHLWVAHYDGWRVTRFTPDGTVERVIEMPVAHVTSCAFGGTDLSTLYVTCATKSLTDEARAAQPLAGGLFAIDLSRTGLRGTPQHRFAG